MSTISIGSDAQLYEAHRTESGRKASLAFAIFAAALAAIAFTSPITHAWKFSTYEFHVTNDESTETSVREGTFARQFAVGSLGLFGLSALTWPGGRTIRIRGILGVLCVAYMMWCAASCLWSDDPAMSLRRWIALMCEVAAALAIAKRLTPRQFLWIVFACTLTWLGLGIVAELSLNTFQPWQQEYRFAGLFHPNDTGVACALLLMASLYLARGEERKAWWQYAIVCAAFAMLVLTGSRTATFGAIASIAAMWFITSSSTKRLVATVLIGMSLGITVLVGVGVFDLSGKLIVLGRQDEDEHTESLTGRLPLWQELIDYYVPQRPLTGYGYGAFWTPEHSAEITTWSPVHAHSTYLDLALNVGLIGAFLCLAPMILAIFKGVRLETRHAMAGYGFMATVVLFALVRGVLETAIGITSFFSFFGICCICYLMLDSDDDLPVISRRAAFPSNQELALRTTASPSLPL